MLRVCLYIKDLFVLGFFVNNAKQMQQTFDWKSSLVGPTACMQVSLPSQSHFDISFLCPYSLLGRFYFFKVFYFFIIRMAWCIQASQNESEEYKR